MSDPLEHDSLLAGNPLAHLEPSDQPGGTVRVQVAEIIGGSTECDAAGQPSNVRVLTILTCRGGQRRILGGGRVARHWAKRGLVYDPPEC